MSSQHTEFVKHNEHYVANFGNKGNLAMPPAKKLIIGRLPVLSLGHIESNTPVTCMDARLE
jgi:hypothetical protein